MLSSCLANGYRTTRIKNDFKNCFIKLAYCSDGVYKELDAIAHGGESVMEMGNELEKDLDGTGILSNSEDNSEEDNSEEKDESDTPSEGDSDADSRDHDFSGESLNKDDTLDATEDNVQNPKPMDLSQKQDVDTESVHMDSDCDSDVIFVGISRPNITKKRVFRSRSYKCHICSKDIASQVNFISHMKTEHPDSKLRCTLCPNEYSSPNGLFKHERSHEYLKYYCEWCTYVCQFPYQIRAHENTHTQEEQF